MSFTAICNRSPVLRNVPSNTAAACKLSRNPRRSEAFPRNVATVFQLATRSFSTLPSEAIRSIVRPSAKYANSGDAT